jgi:hypothetical protein
MLNLSLKDFLICENKVYLGQRISDVLSAIQDLEENKGGMGARQLVANSDRIVGQIRKILHGTWSKKEEKWLLQLQKIGVALAKAIEDNDQLEETLSASSQEIQDLMTKMKVPITNLGSDDIEDANKTSSSSRDSQLSDPQGKDPKQQNTQQQKNPQQQGTEQNPQQGTEPKQEQNPQDMQPQQGQNPQQGMQQNPF